jgi:hypothetical protein
MRQIGQCHAFEGYQSPNLIQAKIATHLKTQARQLMRVTKKTCLNYWLEVVK